MSSTRIGWAPAKTRGAKIRTGAPRFRPSPVALLALLAAPAAAQPADSARAWRLVADGTPVAWSPPRAVSPDSAGAAAALALSFFQRQGFLFSRVDSATTSPPTLFATRGPAPLVGAFVVEGATVLADGDLRGAFETREGRPFSPAAFDRDLAALAARYERRGRPLARLRPALVVRPGPPAVVDVRVTVEEGEGLVLERVELVGARQTSDRFAARTAGLRPGEPFGEFEPEAIRRDLEATGLFARVGAPVLAVGDSGAVVRVPVEEAPPGTFDVVLGYLPATGGGSGQVVGSGLLELRNLFGGGRAVRLRLVRNPGLVAAVDVRASWPFVLGLPLRVEGAFEGLGQDSTFARQRFRGEAAYRIAPGLDVTLVASRERVEPGVFGARSLPGDASGRPRVTATSAVWGGVGLRYRRLDAPLAPRRGLVVEALAESGVRRSQRPDSAVGGAGTAPQQRLTAALRAFVPTLRRQALVVGGDAAVLLGGRDAAAGDAATYDEGDLFRIGGARSLRGYDEDQFAGNVVGRALAEYRYALDPTSYAFLFADLGYVGRPATPGAAESRDVRPGYGLGLQYRTPLGLVTVTYALSPDIGLGQGKVHAGLSFGL